jgi:hypothetical protein
MNFQTFKMMAAKWASEKIIPALAPEGPLRWVFAFAGMNKVMPLIDQYASFIPSAADGSVDMEALEAALNNAFSAQPTLKLTIPEIPALATMGMGATVVSFTKADADSLLAYLKGSTTTTQVTL